MTNDHKQRYKHVLQQYRFARRIEADKYWRCMVLLCTVTPSLWEKVEPHLDMKRGDAFLDQVQQQEYLSSSEAGLLSLARNLYNQAVTVDIAELANTLDEDNWQLVLEALKIYRGEE